MRWRRRRRRADGGEDRGHPARRLHLTGPNRSAVTVMALVMD